MPRLPLAFMGSDITVIARFLDVFAYDLPFVQYVHFCEHLLERPDLPRIDGEVIEILTGHRNLILRALIRKYGHVCDLVVHVQTEDPGVTVPLFTVKRCVFRELHTGTGTADDLLDARYPFTADEIVEHGTDPDWQPIPAAKTYPAVES